MSIVRIVAVAAFAAAFLSAQETGKPAEAALKATQAQAATVGVVNLDRLMETYPKWIKLKADIEGMQKTFDERLSQMTRSISELKASMDATEQGSPEFRIKELQHALAMQERKGQADLMRDQIELEFARSQIVIYEDFEAAIGKVAKQRGLQLVLRQYDPMPAVADPAKLSPRQVQKRLAEIDRRNVLFAAETVDITTDVVKVLMVPLDTGKANDKPNADRTNGSGNAKAGGQ